MTLIRMLAGTWAYRPVVAATVLLLAAVLIAGGARAQDGTEAVMTAFTTTNSSTGFDAEMTFSRSPRSRLIVLTEPNRVVVDLYDTVSAVKTFGVEPNRTVVGLRQGLVSKNRFRLVFELGRPAIPNLATGDVNGKGVIKLTFIDSDADAFRVAAAQLKEAPVGETGSIVAPMPEKTFTVVVDPGHGGIDTGAIGKHGTQEKDVNLRFALALRDVLAKDPRIKVIMTREDDTFIPLLERSEIARRAKANLFISMHSDSIRYSALRGASVYTLSEKASDSLARELADSENSADRFVDAKWRDGKPEVFDILVELMRRETENLSEHFAVGLVSELGRHDIRLIGNPKRSAGFKVLTAPDVPSVLLEIGYLSNVDDEQLLLDESWRKDSANAIALAIGRFLGTGSQARAASED